MGTPGDCIARGFWNWLFVILSSSGLSLLRFFYLHRPPSPNGALSKSPFELSVPYVRSHLRTGSFLVTLTSCLANCFQVPSALIDRFFYGAWQVSLWNIVRYNAGGGGDSHLYGVEPASFYLRNLVNNFNLVLPLALAAPVMILVSRKPGCGRLLVGLAPLYLWLGAMSCLPHKEERWAHLSPSYAMVLLSSKFFE